MGKAIDKYVIYTIYYRGEFMKRFEVIFYEKKNGECPVEEFILKLDLKMRVKIIGLLEILEEKGNLFREPYSKHLEDGIFEIRCKVGNNTVRILYFFYYRGKIILTNGFKKKTKKTPKSEIELAKNRRKDYIGKEDMK